ncbi:MAG: TonB-dependent receptor [Ekhidna sp.]
MAQRTVSGKVVDDTGEALPGVNVVIKGTTTGVTTDLDGNYQISVEDGATLVFSYVGFETQEIAVGARTTIDVTLGGATELQEVVVVAFGEQSRKTLSSSVSSVSAEDIANVSVPNFERNLQGRAAGVNVQAASGTLGAPAYIRVRGTSSITASSQPLIVIDGVPLVQENIGTTAGANGQSALAAINSNDIASMEILKDAAGTALYGSRAANGVILITTKRGQAGKPQVNFGGYAGWSEATELPEILTGPEFAEMWNESIIGGLQGIGFDRATAESVGAGILPLDPATVPSTPWLDLVTQTGSVSEFYANVSGGDESTRYYFGATRRDEEGFIIGNELRRTGIRASVDKDLTDKIRAGLSISPTRTEINRIFEENEVNAPYTFSFLISPVQANTDEEGNLIDDPGVFLRAFNGTPTINAAEIDFIAINTQTLTNTYLEVDLIDGLTARSEFGASFFQYEERLRAGERTTRGNPAGSARGVFRNRLNYTWTNLLTYRTSLGDGHNLQVQTGTQYQSSRTTQVQADGTGFPGDAFTTLASAATPSVIDGVDTEFDFFGILGRVAYDFNQKYLFSFNVRRDGSSRFAEDNRYGTFMSVSAGWNISDEAFFGGASEILSTLKLRGSYGQVGNAEIGNFDALALASGTAAYNGNPGTRANQLSNPELKWETTTQLDVSLDFGFLQDRITGSFTYFNKQTEDLLLDVPIPSTTGFTILTQNIGELENSGIEIELNASILQGPLTWDLGVNVATINNEVKALAPGVDIIRFGADGENVVEVGQPLGAFSLVRYAGVDPNNGDALYINSDGDEVNVFNLNDRVIAGDPFPDYFGGINSTWGFKGLELTTFWQFNVGNDVFREEGQFSQTNLQSIFNQEKNQLDYWTPTNTDASIPQPRNTAIIGGPSNGGNASTRYLEDGSYIRLKTVTLAYTLPTEITQKIGIQRIRAFASGQNLLTFTNYGGPDPEVNSNRAGNANVSQGNTFFAQPQAKTYTFGLNFTL